MKTISTYTSYRAFLKAAFVEEKRSSRGVTLAQFAKHLGLSASGLNMIFSGSRSLTVANLHQVARALNLSTSDREYFEALVLKEQAPDSETQVYYSRKLKKIAKLAKVKSVRVSDKRLLSSWLTPAILIFLIDIMKIKDRESLEKIDIEYLSKKFSLKPDQATALISAFQESELLGIDTDDKVHIVFDKLNHQLPQKIYVQSVLSELGKRVDRDFESKNTLFRGLVFSMDQDQLAALRKDITGVFEKYMSKTAKEPEKNILLQALIGVFPVLNQLE